MPRARRPRREFPKESLPVTDHWQRNFKLGDVQVGLTVNAGEGGTYTPVPEGSHLGYCVLVVDLGVRETQYGNKKKVLLGWELPHEEDDRGQPRLVSKQYTASLNEKATLRHDLESWRGQKFTEQDLEGFDLRNVAGKPCYLSITHADVGGRTYANVAAVMAVPRGTSVARYDGPVMVYDPDQADAASVMTQLPKWIRKMLGDESLEGESSSATVADDDEIPF